VHIVAVAAPGLITNPETTPADHGDVRDHHPICMHLVLLAAAAAPVVFPDHARKLFRITPDDPEFQERYADGLQRLIAHLSQGSG